MTSKNELRRHIAAYAREGARIAALHGARDPMMTSWLSARGLRAIETIRAGLRTAMVHVPSGSPDEEVLRALHDGILARTWP